MAITNDIQRALMFFAKGQYDVVLPNFFHGHTECDLFRITQADFIYEYEIKISRSDFFADFKKKDKHEILKAGIGKYCPNRFFYVTTENLVSIDEVPKYAGLLYFDGVAFFDVKKNAPLIHRNKVGFEMYREVCRILSSRDEEQRKRIRKIRNTDFDKEIAAMKREVVKLQEEKRQCSTEAMMYRMLKRKEAAN